MSANLAVFKPEVDCGIREGTQSRGRVLKVKKKGMMFSGFWVTGIRVCVLFVSLLV